MAKISANGAVEVARITAINPRTGSKSIYVFCSDGRVMARVTGDSETGYTIMARKVKWVSHSDARDKLKLLAYRHGLEVKS